MAFLDQFSHNLYLESIKMSIIGKKFGKKHYEHKLRLIHNHERIATLGCYTPMLCREYMFVRYCYGVDSTLLDEGGCICGLYPLT